MRFTKNLMKNLGKTYAKLTPATSYDNIFSFLVQWSIIITSLLIFALQIVHKTNDIYQHENLHCLFSNNNTDLV